MHFLTFGALTVCDVTLSIDAGSRVQQQFYVQGILASRTVLLGQTGPFGKEYRPGIVHFPADIFTDFTTTALRLSAENPAFCLLTARRIQQAITDTTHACENAERPLSSGQLPDFTVVDRMLRGLTRLMAYKVLYDLIPEDALTARLGDFLQDDRLAQRLFLSLHHTEHLPHYTQVNLGLLTLALQAAKTGVAAPGEFIRTLGFAFDFYISESELETPQGVSAHVRALLKEHGGDPQRIRKTIEDVHLGRERQLELSRQAWAQLKRSPDRETPEDTLALLAVLRLHQALGDVEEERHLLQMRVQRNVRDLLDRLGLDRFTTDLASLRAGLVGRRAPATA